MLSLSTNIRYSMLLEDRFLFIILIKLNHIKLVWRKSMEKKKNKKLIVVTICIIFITLAVVGTIITVLTIKSNNDKKLIFEAVETEWAKSIPEEQPNFLTAIDNRAYFECKDIKKEADGFYVVTVDVSSPDIKTALNEYQEQTIGESVTDDKIDSAISDIIDSAEIKTTTHSVNVVQDQEGKYYVTFSEGFIDAMFGYAYTDAMNTLINEQSQIEKGE